MRLRSKKRGTTLVEILACLAFLSLAVYPMLSCITYSVKAALRSQQQMLVMALVQDALDAKRASALSSSLMTGSSLSNPVGGGETIGLNTTTTLVAGYTDLYQVVVTATWTDQTTNFNQSTIVVKTYMRAPHA